MLAKLIDTINQCRTLSQQCHDVAIKRDTAAEHYFDRIHQHLQDALSSKNATPPPTAIPADKVQQSSPTPDNKEKQQLPSSTTEVDAILAENKQLKEKLQQMHAIFVNLKGSAATMTDIATQHTKRAKIEKEATSNLRQQVNDLMKETERIRSERDALQSQVQQLQQQINALDESKEELLKKPRVGDVGDEMRQKIEYLISMRKAAETALQATMDSQVEAENQSRSTIKALRSNIEALTTELESETKAKNYFYAVCDTLGNDLQASKEKVKAQVSKVATERSKAAHLQNTINQLRQSNKKKKDKMTELYRRIAMLEALQTTPMAVDNNPAAKRPRIE
ncbi:hypothetical protein O0I10_010596 [Lichtheimia ornata]|uniref:Uncharacterized protein n=1 Tax=Lichtheimia ornata TaxID=688661 RepID=A0AAD7XXP5_9FUNG|nr:uncharacterized protein O0I10_010596 [Lichtheimia ornata]KAJ8653797.1 hypothetical protein O0I10_010596 [Lichtheimia ornata]